MRIYFYDPDSMEETSHIAANVPVSVFDWSSDSKQIAIGTSDGSVLLWNVEIGSKIAETKAHDKRVIAIVWSHQENVFVSGSYDGKTIFWRSSDNSIEEISHTTFKGLCSISWSPDGESIVVGTADNLFMVEIETETIHEFSSFVTYPNQPSLSLDLTKIAYRIGSNIFIKDLRSNEVLKSLNLGTSIIGNEVWSSDLKLFAYSQENEIIVWNVDADEKIFLKGHAQPISEIALSNDGRYLASSTSGMELFIWDLNTGEIVKRLYGHNSYVIDIAWSNDGTKLATSSYQEVFIWNTSTFERIHTLSCPEPYCRYLSWSSNGEFLSGSSGIRSGTSLLIWDLSSGNLIEQFQSESYSIDSSLSPDGKMIAYFDFTSFRIKIVGKGKDSFEKGGGYWWSREVYWIDQNNIMTWGYDQVIRIWGIE